MANKLHSFRFLFASILVLFLPLLCLQARMLSFELHLQLPPLNLHDANVSQQPLTPLPFSDQPLFHFDKSSLTHTHAGSACGVYLADPAASMKLRYVLFTATLRKYQGGQVGTAEAAEAAKETEEGSLVLMGSIEAGAVAVVGGTGSFAFASGQAKVDMAAAESSEQLIIVFEVELQSKEEIAVL